MPNQSTTTAAAERAAIVAWLRAQAREAADVIDHLTDGPHSTEARRSLTTAGSTYATAADLIEEGAHHAD